MDLVKMLGTTLGVAVTTAPAVDLLSATINQPVWGIPVTVLGAAATGAALSLCFGDPVPTRRALFGQVIAAMFFGAGLAALVADALNLDWAVKNMSMFALLTAALIRWFLPTAIDRGRQLIKEFRLSFGGLKSDNRKGDD